MIPNSVAGKLLSFRTFHTWTNFSDFSKNWRLKIQWYAAENAVVKAKTAERDNSVKGLYVSSTRRTQPASHC